MQHPLDPNAKKVSHYAHDYGNQIGLEVDWTQLMNIPTQYNDSTANLGRYLENEIARNLPIAANEVLSACHMYILYDSVTQIL